METRIRRKACALAIPMLFALIALDTPTAGAGEAFVFPDTNLSVNDAAILLAIDDGAQPLKRNLAYFITRPVVCAEPVLTPSRDNRDAPDFLATHFYGTVLHDEGKFRMWCYPCHLGLNPVWPEALQAQAGMEVEDYYAEVGLATIPRDQWGGLGLVDDFPEGSVWTAPITLPDSGCAMTLNAVGVASIRVEVADSNFQLLEPFSGEMSGAFSGPDGLDCVVQWPNASLGELAEKTVRLRVNLLSEGEPRLYAINLSASRDAQGK